MAVQGRVARLTALALATGTLVAASAGLASPASAAADARQITANGTGSALKITINLPAAAAAVLGTSSIVQTISLTDGSVSTVGLPAAQSSAVLGKGTIPKVSDLLAQSTSAALGGKLQDSQPGTVVDLNGINASILPLSSKVADPSTDGVLAKSSSAVARVSIGAPLAATNALTAPVQAVLDTALSTVANTTSAAVPTVADTLNGAIDTLNATASQTTAVTAPVQAAVDSLTKTLDGLTTTLTGLSGATTLLSLDSVTSDQVISRQGSAVSSNVVNAVKNISVLNGLVKIQAVTSEATATAGGLPGSAKAATNAPVFKVDIANGALTALLDENGLNVGKIGEGLPLNLQGTVNTALGTVNGLLNQVAGVDVAIGKGVTEVAPDGTSAAAAIATTVLTVDPPLLHGVVAAGLPAIPALLPADKKFLQLELVSAQASVANRLVAAPVAPAAAPTSLPRTGAELPVAIAGTVLLGVAMVIRRRRTAEV